MNYNLHEGSSCVSSSDVSELEGHSTGVMELNVGGRYFSTSTKSLTRVRDSLLADMFDDDIILQRDSKSKYFIDRDGELFAHVLDFLRSGKLVLAPDFNEFGRLKDEADYYKLPSLKNAIEMEEKLRQEKNSPAWTPGNYITLIEHSTYGFRAREQMEGASFKRPARILVAGYVETCRRVFGDSLCSDRDTSHERNRYTSRLYLMHGNMERAFEKLRENGFALVDNTCTDAATRNKMMKADTEDEKWMHCVTHLFVRSDKQ